MSDNSLIPKQYKGAQKDFQQRVAYTSLASAKAAFDKSRTRLLSINKWHEYGGLVSADFTLTDNAGNTLDRAARKGDFIKIDIPGPSHPNGQYDWVRVEDIIYEMPDGQNEMLSLKLQAAHDPNNDEQNTPIHFFEEDSSSSFILKRENHDIVISYHGRNEVPNTHTDEPMENVRNWLIGLSAMLGFSDIQWKGLINGIVNED